MSIFLKFKEIKMCDSIFQMFRVGNIEIIDSILSKLTVRSDGSTKFMFHQYYSNLMSACKLISCQLLIDEKKEEEALIIDFQKVAAQFWNSDKRRAEENLRLNRQEKSRRSENLPSNKDIQGLLRVTYDKLVKLSDISSYIDIRSYLGTYLTVMNARRGGRCSE